MALTDKPLALEGLPPALHLPVRRYTELLRQVMGDDLLALVFFGGATAGRFDPPRQVAYSVVVLREVSLPRLRELARHGPQLGALGLAAPQIMTPEYIRASLDTFPLELLEIQQNHRVVCGEDLFEALPIEDSHVRLQCERQLKALLHGLWQGLLLAAGNDKNLAQLDVDAALDLLRTLRGLLWLNNQREGLPREEVLLAVEEHLQLPLPGLRRALDPQADHDWEEFCLLHDEVSTLLKLVENKG